MEMSFEVDDRRHIFRGIMDGVLHSIRGLDSKRKKKLIHEKPEMILNSLFKVENAWSYDNPLYRLDDDRSLDSNLEMRIVDSICDPISASGLQTGPIKEILEVYTVRNAHSFIFDSHVHDIFMMHNSRVHVLNSWGDSLSCVKFGGKDDQSLGLLPLEAYTSTTLGDGIELVRLNNRWFEKMLQELFGDDMDIMQFFLWDPGGEFLEDKQFQEGWTVMSLF